MHGEERQNAIWIQVKVSLQKQMVVWTILSLGVSQLRLIWSTGSMQVFPWEQDRGVRPAFPLPDKAIHTHTYTHAYVHTHACYHLIRVSQLSSVTGRARNTMTPLCPQIIFRGRVWEEIQGQMARDRDGQSFLFQWTQPQPPHTHTHTPSSRQICYDYLVKPNLIGKSWTWSDGPNLYLINSQQCAKKYINI